MGLVCRSPKEQAGRGYPRQSCSRSHADGGPREARLRQGGQAGRSVKVSCGCSSSQLTCLSCWHVAGAKGGAVVGRPRCARIRVRTDTSVMKASTTKEVRHLGQLRTSTSSTRRSSCAQGKCRLRAASHLMGLAVAVHSSCGGGSDRGGSRAGAGVGAAANRLPCCYSLGSFSRVSRSRLLYSSTVVGG